MNQSKIGNFIAELRKEKAMTQSDLASKMSVSVNAVSKWERGLSMPDVSLLRPLSEELGITINELLCGEKILVEELTTKTDETILQTIEYKDKEKKKALLQTIAWLLFFFLLIGGLNVWNLFIRGTKETFVSYHVKESNGTISIFGNLLNKEKVYNHVSVTTENGTMKIMPFSSYQSIFNKNNSFNLNYSLKGIEKVYFLNELVWQDEKVISKLANQLYEVKNPYIGNMPANGKIASLLEIQPTLGNFKTSLITSQKPYEWNFLFEKQYSKEDSIYLNKMMNQYAVLLLALTDNLDVVKWTWSDGITTSENSVTTDQVNQKIASVKGESLPDHVKKYSDSIYLINELLTMIDFSK